MAFTQPGSGPRRAETAFSSGSMVSTLSRFRPPVPQVVADDGDRESVRGEHAPHGVGELIVAQDEGSPVQATPPLSPVNNFHVGDEAVASIVPADGGAFEDVDGVTGWLNRSLLRRGRDS